MVFTVETSSLKIPCQQCGATVAIWADGKFRVRIKRQWVVTSQPVSISCGRCEFINDFHLTESETVP